jgi:DNA-binding transcriptional regulator YiaG
VPEDPYAERDAALSDAFEAYRDAIKADRDPQRALVAARNLGWKLRDLAKSTGPLVAERAVEIRDREKLTLAKLAQRFGVSVPRAQQWYDEGRQAEQQREVADG